MQHLVIFKLQVGDFSSFSSSEKYSKNILSNLLEKIMGWGFQKVPAFAFRGFFYPSGGTHFSRVPGKHPLEESG